MGARSWRLVSDVAAGGSLASLRTWQHKTDWIGYFWKTGQTCSTNFLKKDGHERVKRVEGGAGHLIPRSPSVCPARVCVSSQRLNVQWGTVRAEHITLTRLLVMTIFFRRVLFLIVFWIARFFPSQVSNDPVDLKQKQLRVFLLGSIFRLDSNWRRRWASATQVQGHHLMEKRAKIHLSIEPTWFGETYCRSCTVNNSKVYKLEQITFVFTSRWGERYVNKPRFILWACYCVALQVWHWLPSLMDCY